MDPKVSFLYQGKGGKRRRRTTTIKNFAGEDIEVTVTLDISPNVPLLAGCKGAGVLPFEVQVIDAKRAG